MPLSGRDRKAQLKAWELLGHNYPAGPEDEKETMELRRRTASLTAMPLRFTIRGLLWLTVVVTGTLWSLEDLYERAMG